MLHVGLLTMHFLPRLFLAVLLVYLSGCSGRHLPWIADQEGWPVPPGIEDIHSEEVTAIVQDIAVEFKHSDHLRLEFATTYFDMGIRTIQLEFTTQDIVELCDARKTIVDLTEALLARLNQNPILGSEFASYPFRSENLEIYITYETYFGRYVDPYYIHWTELEDDVVTFYTFSVDDLTKFCWHKRTEPYATVREIVLYQREAERKYEELHGPNTAVFGNQRYFPNDEITVSE